MIRCFFRENAAQLHSYFCHGLSRGLFPSYDNCGRLIAVIMRYVPEFEKCWQAYERPVGDSWRVDETYLKVGGQWVYLYRSVDKRGKIVESYLSRTRDVTAAKAFFRKALKRHGEPRVITLDGFEATHAALRRMGLNNEFNYRWDNPYNDH